MSVTVKLNGVFSHIVAPIVQEEVDRSWWDSVTEFADNFVSSEFEMILKPIGKAIGEGIVSLFHLLSTYSVEIITIGAITCGVGMMVAPMVGSSGSKWFGRLMFVFMAGSIWRLILA